jgi:hypothetical protein
MCEASCIALSMRELIRIGHLFTAMLLTRPLAERVAILKNLLVRPGDIHIWHRGWQHNEAPSLARMLEVVFAEGHQTKVEGRRLTAAHNDLLHGKPGGAQYSLDRLSDDSVAHVLGGILNNPDLCDTVCNHAQTWTLFSAVTLDLFFPDAAPDWRRQT